MHMFCCARPGQDLPSNLEKIRRQPRSSLGCTVATLLTSGPMIGLELLPSIAIALVAKNRNRKIFGMRALPLHSMSILPAWSIRSNVTSNEMYYVAVPRSTVSQQSQAVLRFYITQQGHRKKASHGVAHTPQPRLCVCKCPTYQYSSVGNIGCCM